MDVVHPERVADEFGRYLAERCRANVDVPVFAALKQQSETSPIDFSTDCQLSRNVDFWTFELKTALKSLRDVAEGPDEVHNLLLKCLLPPVLTTLLWVLNDLWRGCLFPASWRRSVVIPILKQGKSGYHLSEYRPISLTSSRCKLFENWFVNDLCGSWSAVSCLMMLNADFVRFVLR